MARCHVGLDLGGTNIKAVALAPDNTVLKHDIQRTPSGGPKAIISRMTELAQTVAAGTTIASVGVTVPGIVDMPTGTVQYLTNVPGKWEGRPLARELGETLKAPAALINDVRAATYGELRLGAGRDCSHFVMIAVGTGIGGGIVIDGELYLGSAGQAGEVGHQVIELHGPRCGCGNWGCGEALASGPAMVAEAVRLVLQGMPTALREACGGDVSKLSARTVAEVAASGDQYAQGVLRREAHRLGTLASNLVVVLNPKRVIIGGGVSLAGEPLLAGIRQTLEQRIAWYLPWAPVEVVAAQLGEDAGALGAAAWGRRQAERAGS